MNKKYELTNNIREVNGVTLYRIISLRDFSNIRKGDLGGYVQSEHNLSHENSCWIHNESCVYNNARIYEHAYIYGDASIYGNAEICGNATIYDQVQIFDNAFIYGIAEIYDQTQIYGNAQVMNAVEVHNNVKIYGNANICNNVKIYGDACIYGDAFIHGNAIISYDADINNEKDYLTLNNFGKINFCITMYKTKCNSVYINCDKFNGPLIKFINDLNNFHSDIVYEQQGALLKDIAKFHFGLNYKIEIK